MCSTSAAGSSLPPLLLGAGQERGRRPGTENVPYIVALGEACRIAGAMLERESKRLSGLAGDLFAALKRDIPDIILVGHPTQRLPNTLNVLFPNVSGRKVSGEMSARHGLDRLRLPRR